MNPLGVILSSNVAGWPDAHKMGIEKKESSSSTSDELLSDISQK